MVSPDGAHLYVAGFFSQSLAVLARDAGTGGLSFVEVFSPPSFTPSSVLLSADGAFVYTADGGNMEVAVLARDAGTGALTLVEEETGGFSPSGFFPRLALALSPDGTSLYTATGSEAYLVVSARDGTSGELSLVERRDDALGPVNGLDGAAAVAVSPGGAHLYACGKGDDGVAIFARGADGSLGFLDALLGSQPGAPPGLDFPVDLTLSPDGAHLYVATDLGGSILAFARDPATGALAWIETESAGLVSVLGLSISPDGAHLYAAANFSELRVWSRDPGTGEIAPLQVLVDGMGGVDGLGGAQGVLVSADGANVYTTANLDDAVAVFDRDPASGLLSFAEAHFDGVGGVDGIGGARGLAESPDGAHLYATGEFDSAVAAFARDPATGALGFLGAESHLTLLSLASGLAVSGDGRFVYASAFFDLVVFRRDPATGLLDLFEFYLDGPLADGLFGAREIALSPDGVGLYLATEIDDSVVAFRRAEIFTDGFENGDVSAWTLLVEQ